MPTKTLYFKSTGAPGGLGSFSLQDGGSAPSGSMATGWTVGTLAAGNQSAMWCLNKLPTSNFAVADPLSPASLSGKEEQVFRSENAFTGTFVAGSWSLQFATRASASANTQRGRVRCRLWKSNAPYPAGGTNIELTSAVLFGAPTTTSSTTVSALNQVIWSAPTSFVFNNEFLWVEPAWEVTTAGNAANSDVMLYQESNCRVITPNFVTAFTWVKHAGVWKQPTTFVKHAGTWKAPTTFVKTGGVWKQV